MIRFLIILLAIGGMGAIAWFFTPARGYLEKTVELNPPADFIQSSGSSGPSWAIHLNGSDISCQLTIKPDAEMKGLIPMKAPEALSTFVARATGGMLQPYNPTIAEWKGVSILSARAGNMSSGTEVIHHIKAFGYGGNGYLYACTANPVSESAIQEALTRLTTNINFVRGFNG